MSSRFNFVHGTYARFGLPSLRGRNPCCIDLQAGARFIAIAQMAYNCFMLAMVFLVIILVTVLHNVKDPKGVQKDLEQDLEQVEHSIGAATLIVLLVIMLITVPILLLQLYLHRYLYVGVLQRDVKRVNRWWTIFCFIVAIGIIYEIYSYAKQGTAIRLIETLKVIFDIYSLVVIHAFKTAITGIDSSTPTVEFERVL